MKLVREHINFTRGLDPRTAMGTGWDKHMTSQIEKFIQENPQKGHGVMFFPLDSYYDDDNQLNLVKAFQTLAAYGELEMLEYLVKKGVPVNGYEYKPMRAAINFNHIDVVKFFLKHGAHLTKTHIKAARKAAGRENKYTSPLVDLLIKEFHKQEHKKNPESYNAKWAQERMETKIYHSGRTK